MLERVGACKVMRLFIEVLAVCVLQFVWTLLSRVALASGKWLQLWWSHVSRSSIRLDLAHQAIWSFGRGFSVAVSCGTDACAVVVQL